MSAGRNCYPESDVLINNYNIRDKELLEKFEIQKVFAKLLGLDIKPEKIGYTYDTEHLVNIHKYLFGDIYVGLFQMHCKARHRSQSIP